MDGNTASLSIVPDGKISPVSVIVRKDDCSLYFLENLFSDWIGGTKN